MRFLLGCLFYLATFPAHAGVEALIGSWDGGDTASMSIYGTLRITSKTITWGGHNKYNPKCQVSYIVIPEESDVIFEDKVGNIFAVTKNNKSVRQIHHNKGGGSSFNEEKRNFSTYMLRLSGSRCLSGMTHLRLTFPFEDDFTYLNMIEYSKPDNPSGWMHFHKVK